MKAEDAAKAAKLLAEDTEKRQDVMQKWLRTFKDAIKTGSEKLQEELLDLLAGMGLWLWICFRRAPTQLAWAPFSSGFVLASPCWSPGHISMKISVPWSPSVLSVLQCTVFFPPKLDRLAG